MQNLSSSLSTASGAAQHELQTPSKDDVQYSTKTCTKTTKSSADTESGSSTTPKEASRLTLLNECKTIFWKAYANFYLLVSYTIYFRSFALDRRWITIHTVCLDLLNSPELWDMKKMQVRQPFSNLCKAMLLCLRFKYHIP